MRPLYWYPLWICVVVALEMSNRFMLHCIPKGPIWLGSFTGSEQLWAASGYTPWMFWTAATDKTWLGVGLALTGYFCRREVERLPGTLVVIHVVKAGSSNWAGPALDVDEITWS